MCTRQIRFSRFAHLYSAGAHGVIVRTHSFSSDALDPKVKHFSRMNFNLAELEAGDVDPEGWPILTDGRGNITEGVGYNVFIATGGVIRTAGDRGILQGVSRAMVSTWHASSASPSSRRISSPPTSIRPTRRSSRAQVPASCP